MAAADAQRLIDAPRDLRGKILCQHVPKFIVAANPVKLNLGRVPTNGFHALEPDHERCRKTGYP